jgi:hypothetical protein
MKGTLKRLRGPNPFKRYNGDWARRWLVELTLALLLGLSFEVRADTISVQATADADIRQFSPNANFGGTNNKLLTTSLES